VLFAGGARLRSAPRSRTTEARRQPAGAASRFVPRQRRRVVHALGRFLIAVPVLLAACCSRGCLRATAYHCTSKHAVRRDGYRARPTFGVSSEPDRCARRPRFAASAGTFRISAWGSSAGRTRGRMRRAATTLRRWSAAAAARTAQHDHGRAGETKVQLIATARMEAQSRSARRRRRRRISRSPTIRRAERGSRRSARPRQTGSASPTRRPEYFDRDGRAEGVLALGPPISPTTPARRGLS